MAQMTVIGQDQKIRDRLGQLQEMFTALTGQVADLEAQLEDRRAQRARVEGAIIELRVLLVPEQEPEDEKGEG